MNTFTKMIGRHRHLCLLSEREFKSQADAEAHQESLIRKLQASGAVAGDYSFGELFGAYQSRSGS